MPVLRYALTNDLDDPVVILADDLPMLDESLAGSLLFHDVSKSTARGNLSAVLGVLRAEGSYDAKTGRAKIFSAEPGRQFLNRLLRRSGCEVRGIRNRGGKRVSHPERSGWLDHTLGSVRTFVEQLYKAGVLEGQRALDVDGWHLRDAGQHDAFRRNAVRSAASAAAIVRDTGRYALAFGDVEGASGRAEEGLRRPARRACGMHCGKDRGSARFAFVGLVAGVEVRQRDLPPEQGRR
jgi:hypothetical protein